MSEVPRAGASLRLPLHTCPRVPVGVGGRAQAGPPTLSTRGGPLWAFGTNSRRRPLWPVPLTRTSSTTTGRSGMVKPNSLMYLHTRRSRRAIRAGSQAGGPRPGRPRRGAHIPLDEACPKVARYG